MTEHPQGRTRGWPLLIPVAIALAISAGMYFLGGDAAAPPPGSDSAYNAGYMVGRLAALPVLVAIVILIRNAFFGRRGG